MATGSRFCDPELPKWLLEMSGNSGMEAISQTDSSTLRRADHLGRRKLRFLELHRTENLHYEAEYD
jgi:hypothetical protein